MDKQNAFGVFGAVFFWGFPHSLFIMLGYFRDANPFTRASIVVQTMSIYVSISYWLFIQVISETLLRITYGIHKSSYATLIKQCLS